MKVFNITNPNHFIERIAATCRGTVELVEQDGTRIPLAPAKNASAARPFSSGTGHVDVMELCFSDGKDAVSILNYLSNMNLACF